MAAWAVSEETLRGSDDGARRRKRKTALTQRACKRADLLMPLTVSGNAFGLWLKSLGRIESSILQITATLTLTVHETNGPNYKQPPGLCQAINLLNASKKSTEWPLAGFWGEAQRSRSRHARPHPGFPRCEFRRPASEPGRKSAVARRCLRQLSR